MIKNTVIKHGLPFKDFTVKGFTIVELVAVIAIMSILTAIAMPRFVGNNIFEQRALADLIFASLNFAQKTAVAQHTNVFVRVTSSNLRLCYDTACTLLINNPVTGVGYNIPITSGVSLVANVNPLRFDKTGKGNNTFFANYTVTDTASGVASKYIVEPNTGYIHPDK